MGAIPYYAGFYAILSIFLVSCKSASAQKPSQEVSKENTVIRVLLDRPPNTLNPRIAIDTSGQRIGELLFAALTSKDPDLKPQPALAREWETKDRGRRWVFHLKPGIRDHAGQDITAERLKACFEEYRSGKPRSIQISASPALRSIEAIAPHDANSGGEIVFHLDRPDPYLAANLTLWRYFTTGDPSHPCREPEPGDAIVGSGDYRAQSLRFADLTPERSLALFPVRGAGPTLVFSWSLDDNSKALHLIRGDVDVLPNSISLAKTRWLERAYGDRFRVIARSRGVNVSYLAFNLRNPFLKNPAIRKAIALSINREEIVRNKLYGFGTVAQSLLSPTLPESSPNEFPYDPGLAEKILDQAGYPRGSNGNRFSLRFKTTSVRDGFETALVLQNSLRRIGIEVVLDIVEPAVFFASVKKGAFDLHTSRWIGVSDASIFQRILKTGAPDNRGSYSNAEMDALLDEASTEVSESRRRSIYSKVQKKIAEDLPFLPLWYWDPAVIVRKDLQGLEPSDVSVSGSLAPLARLR